MTVNKIAKALGAEHVGKFEVKGGAIGAAEAAQKFVDLQKERKVMADSLMSAMADAWAEVEKLDAFVFEVRVGPKVMRAIRASGNFDEKNKKCWNAKVVLDQKFTGHRVLLRYEKNPAKVVPKRGKVDTKRVTLHVNDG